MNELWEKLSSIVWFHIIEFLAGCIIGGIIQALISEKIHDFREQLKIKPNFHKRFDKVEDRLKRIKKEFNKVKFEPDFILGISSEDLVGGVITGAWLASPAFFGSSAGKSVPFFQSSRGEKPSDQVQTKINSHPTKRILLVDDESQTGGTIRDELNELQKLFPDADIRVVVIVVRRASWNRVEADGTKFWDNPNHFVVHKDVGDNIEVNWPWSTRE